jgi:hypothetical protein
MPKTKYFLKISKCPVSGVFNKNIIFNTLLTIMSRGYYLMKKHDGRKSRDTVPLTVCCATKASHLKGASKPVAATRHPENPSNEISIGWTRLDSCLPNLTLQHFLYTLRIFSKKEKRR